MIKLVNNLILLIDFDVRTTKNAWPDCLFNIESALYLHLYSDTSVLAKASQS